MEFRPITRHASVAVEAKEILQVTGCTYQEFIDYLVDTKVDTELKEMDFYQDDDIAYGYFEEEDKVYLFIKNHYKNEEEVEKKSKEKPDLKKSTLFTNTLIALMLFLSSLLPNIATAAGYFNGSMVESSTTYTGLSSARFNTPTGAKTIPGHLNVVQSEQYQDIAFSFINPNRIGNQASVTMESLPDGANEDLLTAILAYRQKFSLANIVKSTGIQVTQRQVDEATQLALWIQAGKLQVNYQIDTNSISDSAVRTLATEITTWATQQVTSLPENMTMGNYLFPMYEPKIDASKAKVTKSGNNVEYGPYSITGQTGMKFQYGVLGGIIVDESKKKITQLTSNQNFYLQFPQTYTGQKAARFIGDQMEYSLNYGKDRLWLDRAPKEFELQFAVGGSNGNNGMIQVNATDAVTGEPVADVAVKVSTTSPLTTLHTNASGTTAYTTATGTYYLEFTAPDGYISPEAKEVTVGFAGDVQTINLKLNWSKAVVNFYSVDSQSLSPTGDSEAFIYNSEGKAVKRVALKDGKVLGITLPEGDYRFVQYKSSGGYAVNVGTEFTAKGGEVTDVSIAQDPNAYPTVITIDNAATTDSWVYTISTDDKVLFRLNSSNTLTIPLPQGKYTVMAQKSDGTASTVSNTFTTVLNGSTEVVLEQEIGTETVTFTLVDTKVEKPIPNVVLGLFDEDHNLITYKTASAEGVVTFENVKKYSVYYVNVLAAPSTVSGYSADGNRFLGYTRDYTIHLYSLAEIQEVTKVDTLYRVPNVTYMDTGYVYP